MVQLSDTKNVLKRTENDENVIVFLPFKCTKNKKEKYFKESQYYTRYSYCVNDASLTQCMKTARLLTTLRPLILALRCARVSRDDNNNKTCIVSHYYILQLCTTKMVGDIMMIIIIIIKNNNILETRR